MEMRNWPVIEATSVVYTVGLFNGLYWFYISEWAFSGVTYLVYFFLPLTVVSVLIVSVAGWLHRQEGTALSKMESWAITLWSVTFFLKMIMWITYPL